MFTEAQQKVILEWQKKIELAMQPPYVFSTIKEFLNGELDPEIKLCLLSGEMGDGYREGFRLCHALMVGIKHGLPEDKQQSLHHVILSARVLNISDEFSNDRDAAIWISLMAKGYEIPDRARRLLSLFKTLLADKNKTKVLTRAQNIAALLEWQNDNGSIGHLIAAFQDDKTTLDYLELFKQLLVAGLKINEVMYILKLHPGYGATMGHIIARLKKSATTQAYIKLLELMRVLGATDADMRQLLKLKHEGRLSLGDMIATHQDPDATTAYLKFSKQTQLLEDFLQEAWGILKERVKVQKVPLKDVVKQYLNDETQYQLLCYLSLTKEDYAAFEVNRIYKYILSLPTADQLKALQNASDSQNPLNKVFQESNLLREIEDRIKQLQQQLALETQSSQSQESNKTTAASTFSSSTSKVIGELSLKTHAPTTGGFDDDNDVSDNPFILKSTAHDGKNKSKATRHDEKKDDEMELVEFVRTFSDEVEMAEAEKTAENTTRSTNSNSR